jgi:transcriptional accessory protein Tex/SPT6
MFMLLPIIILLKLSFRFTDLHIRFEFPIIANSVGLGPASAKALLTTLKRSGESNSRDHISKALPYPVNTEKPFSNVFINCAGFIRVSSRSRDTTPNLLDLTRIHPNAYFFAYEIVRVGLL